jgi:hypothetical protein
MRNGLRLGYLNKAVELRAWDGKTENTCSCNHTLHTSRIAFW